MSSSSSLNDIIDGEFQNLLQDPQNFPQEFLDWLPQFLSVNAPTISNSDIQGGTFTPVDGANHNIDWGSGTLHFSASTTATDTQSHGLGDVPTFLVAFPGASGVMLGGSADGASVTVDALVPSNFTGTIPYFWLAIA